MAEIIDQSGKMHDVASNAKANAGLTTGIIGTALGGLLTVGGLGGLLGMSKNGCNQKDNCTFTNEDLFIERKQAQNYIDLTKEYYEGRIDNIKGLNSAFFESYKRNVNDTFMLYKNQRDMYDTVNKEQHDNYDKLNQKIIDTSFGLYKNQRDEKDALLGKISELQCKVDVMSAIRPYQDALINAKIDKNALIADYNLSRRTCRMIEGQVVLPNSPEVTGFTSYYPSICIGE